MHHLGYYGNGIYPRVVHSYPPTTRVMRGIRWSQVGVVAGFLIGSLGQAQQALPIPVTQLPKMPISVPGEYYPGPRETADGGKLRPEGFAFLTLLEQDRAILLERLDPTEATESSAHEGTQLRKIGVIRPIPMAFRTKARSFTLQDGGSTQMLHIRSEGALGIRVYITELSLPPGASMFVYGLNADGNPQTIMGPYESLGPFGNGDFWTSETSGEDVIVEVDYLSPISLPDLPFTVSRISHTYQHLSVDGPQTPICGGHQDVSCFPQWEGSSKSVALITFMMEDGSYTCSGTLLNDNDPDTFIPYFLTANHCVSNNTVARTLEAFWFYQTARCNATPPSRFSVPRTTGSSFLAGDEAVDFSLLKLVGNLPAGIWFAGWNANEPSFDDAITVIHHPAGDYKRIAFGRIDLQSFLLPQIRVRFSTSPVEGGSSGSPLFNDDERLIAIASTRPAGASCSNPSANFGKLSKSWPFIRYYVSAQPPAVPAGGAVNGASFSRTTPLAAGSIFSLFGSDLTDGNTTEARRLPLPRQLAGATLLVNGIAAPIFYASPSQINAQFPVELAGVSSATIQVQVETAGGRTLFSPTITVPVAFYSPGIFSVNGSGSGPGAILRASDFKLICPQSGANCTRNRAVRGEIILIYMTGLGQVNGPWVTGTASPGTYTTLADPLVFIGGVQAEVLFSGVAPGFVGLYQVNVRVPLNAPTGDAVPLIVNFRGSLSNTVTVAIGGLPDLVVTFFSAPTQGVIGSRISPVDARIRNEGATNTGPFRIGFYYSLRIGSVTTDTFSGWSCTRDAGLTAGASTSCSGEIGVPASLSPGTYFLWAIVDDLNQVMETDESNNSRVAETGPLVLQR